VQESTGPKRLAHENDQAIDATVFVVPEAEAR